MTVNTNDGNINDEVFFLEKEYDEVFVNDDDFVSDRKSKQLMIIDIGCPRSLMGKKEYETLLDSLTPSEVDGIKEFAASKKFRFGPSKLYESQIRIELPLELDNVKIEAKIFIVNGDITILIGNDMLEPLGGTIHTDERIRV